MAEETRSKILAVDDEPMNVELLDAHLSLDYDVISACSGEEALEVVKAEKPDLILLDIMMPGMDGYEVSKRLKSDPATRFIPIIMVTALSDVGDRIKGSDSGSDEFLTKPVNKEELVSRVKSLLRTKGMHDNLLSERDTLEIQNCVRGILTSMIPVLLQPLPPEQKKIMIYQMTGMVETTISGMCPLCKKITDLASVGVICASVMNQLGGSFSIEESAGGNACVVKGTVCPWGADEARRNPILCNLTRGIFSRIAARGSGAPEVTVIATIGNRDDACVFKIG
ncbi:MAG: response regulator [Methanosarcinales archaeon]|nr:MAG: response regulator [Methanosarcinales archaeon]